MKPFSQIALRNIAHSRRIPPESSAFNQLIKPATKSILRNIILAHDYRQLLLSLIVTFVDNSEFDVWQK